MTAAAILSHLRVVRDLGDPRRGHVVAAGLIVPCALGRTGITGTKREGDGATPAGTFRLLAALYRPDRLPRPPTHLQLTALRPDSGWCDDPGDRAYNQPVRLPHEASHERLWRDDRLYDVVIVLDYNIAPAQKGAGSAIFLHLAREDFAPTAGCVAIAPEAMRHLLPRLGPTTVIDIR